MACFLVPMVLAIITSIIQVSARDFAEKLKLWILNTLLWGGVILLTIEHIWHGEVVPWPPFLTAMINPTNISALIHEIVITGSIISIAVLATWGTILTISHYVSKIMILKAIEHTKKP